MNHALWELTLTTRHRHRELIAERRTCGSLGFLPSRKSLAALRRALGLRLIATGHALAGAEALRDGQRPLRPAQ